MSTYAIKIVYCDAEDNKKEYLVGGNYIYPIQAEQLSGNFKQRLEKLGFTVETEIVKLTPEFDFIELLKEMGEEI